MNEHTKRQTTDERLNESGHAANIGELNGSSPSLYLNVHEL